MSTTSGGVERVTNLELSLDGTTVQRKEPEYSLAEFKRLREIEKDYRRKLATATDNFATQLRNCQESRTNLSRVLNSEMELWKERAERAENKLRELQEGN